jgi:hypothetical protein
MTRECHVRFCEGGGVRFPSATRLAAAMNNLYADWCAKNGKPRLDPYAGMPFRSSFGPFGRRPPPRHGLQDQRPRSHLGARHSPQAVYAAPQRGQETAARRRAALMELIWLET